MQQFFIYLIFISILHIGLFTKGFHLKHLLQKLKLREAKEGRNLLLFISNLNLRTGFQSTYLIPEYKFYTSIISGLLDVGRSRGVKISGQLDDIKKVLQHDLIFSMKIKNEKSSAFFQFTIITLFTWVFVFYSQQLIEIKIPKLVYFIMVSFQVLGMISFFFLSDFFQKKFFLPYDQFLGNLLLFQSLVESSVPLKLALLESKVYQSKAFQLKKFELLCQHFDSALDKLKGKGLSMRDDINLIIAELGQNREEEFRLFHNRLSFFKFLHLSLIYLPIYFLYLISIFKFFMEQ